MVYSAGRSGNQGPPVDRPMPLGDHLEELRRRAVTVLIGLAVILIVAFGFQHWLKELMLGPLRQALLIIGPEMAARLGLDAGPDQGLLVAKEVAESTITALRVSLYAALALGFPLIIHQLWGFVSPALKSSERGLAFLFLPGAALFFYSGVVLGYFVGLPWFYAWLLQWTAADSTISQYMLTQREYFGFFFVMTICFGVILDIPWAVLLLVRTGLVTPETLARQRRFIILGAVVLAAMLSPPDPMSQIALFVPMVLLFEGGLLASRFLRARRQAAATDAGASDRAGPEASHAP